MQQTFSFLLITGEVNIKDALPQTIFDVYDTSYE